MDRIAVRGLTWDSFDRKQLVYPELEEAHHESLSNRITRRLNNTVLRPRPVIVTEQCTGCGACAIVVQLTPFNETLPRRFPLT